MDTQWPRFEVFDQLKAGEPHENAGSVHAPDPELALQNARDVFARRPDHYSMWVVPADVIFSRTAQELATAGLELTEVDSQGPVETYYIFQKLKQAGAHTHVGEVEAASPTHALKLALDKFTRRRPLVWWIVPARAVTRSEPDEIETMFQAAYSKIPYRDQGAYHTVSQLHEIKKTKEGDPT